VEVDLAVQPVQLTQLRQVVAVCMAVAVVEELTNPVRAVLVDKALCESFGAAVDSIQAPEQEMRNE
jgi:hypothetical protein